jgi:tetratricopeptide (TPR) repeat protein
MALATTGDFVNFREALDLVERNLRARGPNPDDLQAKAMVLATRASHRQEAIRLFEDLVGRKELPADQQFFLAQLYEEGGDWPRARAIMLGLLAMEQENPLYVVYYARNLIRRGEANEARTWLERLERTEPNTFRVLELKLRVLKAQQRDKEAEDAVQAYIGGKGPDVALVAAVLDELGLAAAAEEIYRKHLVQSDKPQSLLLFIKYLSGQKRLAEALDHCERAWEVCTPELAAGITVSVLRAGQPNPQQYARATEWIDVAVRKSRSAPLLICRADLLEQQTLYDEAEKAYREVLQHFPGNVYALNNLAWFLARRRGQGAEALMLINQVLDRLGPVAEFLDTRACVYLSLGQPDLAVRDLQTALAQRSTPAGLFHLAEAHYRANNRPAALDAFRQALAGGLKEDDIHPLERTIFRQLQAEVEAESAATPPAKP